jgi:hypothetical protein
MMKDRHTFIWEDAYEPEWRFYHNGSYDLEEHIAYLKKNPILTLTDEEADMVEGLTTGAAAAHLFYAIDRVLWLRDRAAAEAEWRPIAEARQREADRVKELIDDNLKAGRTCDRCCSLTGMRDSFREDADWHPYCPVKHYVYNGGGEHRTSCELWNVCCRLGSR